MSFDHTYPVHWFIIIFWYVKCRWKRIPLSVNLKTNYGNHIYIYKIYICKLVKTIFFFFLLFIKHDIIKNFYDTMDTFQSIYIYFQNDSKYNIHNYIWNIFFFFIYLYFDFIWFCSKVVSQSLLLLPWNVLVYCESSWLGALSMYLYYT